MKKLLFSLMIVALLSMGANVFADTADLYDDKVCIINNSGDAITTLIPVTQIVPNKDWITRISVSSTGTSVLSEAFCAIYDASTVVIMADTGTKTCEGEWEAENLYGSITHDYKRPLKIYNGVVIRQGAYSTVMIEWERYRP